MKEPQPTQPIAINVSTQPMIKPEGGLDPWQRYVNPHQVDIPTIAHRFLMGAVSGMAISSFLLTAHAAFYWFAALLLPLAALLLLRQIRSLNTDLFVFGAIVGIGGSLL